MKKEKNRRSTGGYADPYASFDCGEADKFRKYACDVTLVGVNGCEDISRPTRLIKGKFTLGQFDADNGVTDSTMFDVECCGISGCAFQSQINLGIQQLPEDNSKDVRALAIYDLTDEDNVPDPEVVVRIGGGLK